VIKYPFHKLLLYLLAISKFDRVEFASLLELYLPYISFEFEDPFDYAEKYIKATPIPACVYAGVDDIHGWRIYLGKFKLEDLHAAFNQEQFEDIIYDTDIKRKIDAMSLSSVFRKSDIVKEFSRFDPQYIGIYLDTFADFTKVPNKNSYVAKYIADKSMQRLFKATLDTTSRSKLKVMLGMSSDIDPKALINRAIEITRQQLEEAYENNQDNLQSWIKMQVSFSEKLLKMNAGNKTDLDDLLQELKAAPKFEDPTIYTKDQLEIMYQESLNKPSE
jgi:hypothetical protein